MIIRPATEADCEAITAIYAHYVLHTAATFEIDPPPRDEIAARRRAIVDAGLPYLAAEEDGLVVGYAYAGPYRPRPAYRFTLEDSIYLHPDATGRGLGQQLLAALIEACRATPCRQMIAVIGDSANHASIRLHARLGFRHVGTFTEVGYKFGRPVDTVLMQRPIP